MDLKYKKAYEHLLQRKLETNSKEVVRILSPFRHEKTPSFDIDFRTGRFKDWGNNGFQGDFMRFTEFWSVALRKQGVEPTHLIDEAVKMAGLEGKHMRCVLSHFSSELNLRYNVYNITKTKEGGIKVSVKILHNAQIVHADTPTITSSKKRQEIANKIEQICQVSSQMVDQDLLHLEGMCQEKLFEQQNLNEKPTEIIFTEEEKAEAVAFLKQPNLMGAIKEAINYLGVVGEELLSLLLYLIFTSRKLDSPISAALKGNSSTGKSHVVLKIAGLMPDSDVKIFSYVSAKALQYFGINDLSHKILIILEYAGGENSEYNIRIILSEKKLTIAVPIKDEHTGEYKTHTKTVKGPLTYVFTTTRESTHPENETRFYSVYMDESIKQNENVIEYKKAKYDPEQVGKYGLSDKKIKMLQLCQHLLQKSRVLIPFVKYIYFPATRPRMRRDVERFLALIEISALLHQYQRDVEVVNDEEYLLADIKDYKIAYELAKDLIIGSVYNIPPRSRELLSVCKAMKDNFTRSELAAKTGWSRDDIRKHMNRLTREGYIQPLSGRKGQEYEYSVTDLDEKTSALLSPKQLEQQIAKATVEKKKIKILIKKVSQNLVIKT
ncbi:MAG: hypothetical protein P9L96_03310 [Candidatus Gygaella obscura]|nr:hypothetical protein [Candidatus Gygaella obscura]